MSEFIKTFDASSDFDMKSDPVERSEEYQATPGFSVPFFQPVTPMYSYNPFLGDHTSTYNPLNSEFEKMVYEINSKYTAQGLSNSLGNILANTQESQVFLLKSQMSPPATPGMSPERTFPCTIAECGKKFTSKQSLKSHMAIHADEKFKPFDCTICGSSFRRKHDLTRHHRSLHAPIKPFKCKFCNREYARSDALKRHLQSKAHSLPPELTNIVAAASRQTGYSELL